MRGPPRALVGRRLLPASPLAPYLSGDPCGGLPLVKNRVDTRPKEELLDPPGPYGRAQHHHLDCGIASAQLAYQIGAVPVGQGKVQERHVQAPPEAPIVEYLPGRGLGAGLGYHLQLLLF